MMEAVLDQNPKIETTPGTRRAGRYFLPRLVFVAALIPFVAYCLKIFVFYNLHTVIPGKVFRSAQLKPEQIEKLIREDGVRTVLNLRGCCLGFLWYENELAVGQELSTDHHDLTLSANRLPPPQELRRAVEILDQAEYPILIHCRQGADRTGLIAGMILLLKTDATLSRARLECSPLFAHFPVHSTKRMDDFFDFYEAWLAGKSHTSELFRDWVINHYQPGPCIAEMSLTDPEKSITVGTAPLFSLNVVNQSQEIWKLQPGPNVGIQAVYHLFAANSEKVFQDRSGLKAGEVKPGESTRFEIPIPKLKQPGKYTLMVDLVATEHRSFVQHGNRPLFHSFEVR
jgi:hypothetical protein